MDDIASIGKLTEKEKSTFKENFYKVLVAKILQAIITVDIKEYERLNSALADTTPNEESIKKVLSEINENQVIKQKIDQSIDEVLSELVTNLDQSATVEQKQQILSSLSA